MPSSKKKNRNKRSGKNAGANASTGVKASVQEIMSDELLFERCFERTMKRVPPKDVVLRICQGKELPTQTVCYFLAGGESHDNAHNQYLQRLVDAGLVPAVLALLSQCEDDELCGVIEAGTNTGFEGRVAEPKVWLFLLINIVKDETRLGVKRNHECRMQIVQGIAPLVKRMCDDMKRELFRSTEYWHSTFFNFVGLIFNLAETKEARAIIIRYDGLLALMVQCIFWSDQRPDILKESQPFENVLKSGKIANLACGVVESILYMHRQEDDFKVFFMVLGKNATWILVQRR